MILNLEDCLEHLAGLRESPVKFTIEKTDATIMNSIARQCFKGMALTDRQSALMQEKLQTYRDQFINLDWDFDYAVNQLRQPLRSIDRSKYIKVEDNSIVVRFPFNKTDIVYVQEAANKCQEYHHQKGTHVHHFAYNERNILNLLDRFTKKDFVIDEELLHVYDTVKEIYNNPIEYLSGIDDDYNLININPTLALTIQKEVGESSAENFTKLYDRRFRYGFNHVANLDQSRNELAHEIASRKDKTYHSVPSIESTDCILTALWELDRFPLLVVLDPIHAEEQLYTFANHYRDILDPQEQSVLSVPVPSIEVEDDGTVKLAEFGGNVLLGTGTDNGSDLLQVDGGILATGDVTAYGSSDARLKTNLEPIANAVDKVNTLTGYTFNWNEQAVGKDTTVREAGIIAQDVDAVLPEVVTTRKDGYMAVKYEKIVPLLIEAIKEQDDKIKRLEALVEKLLDEK